MKYELSVYCIYYISSIPIFISFEILEMICKNKNNAQI